MKLSRTLAISFVVTASIITASYSAEPVSRPATVGMSGERLAPIGKSMQQYIDDGWAPGCVTMIARHGKIVHVDCHGYKDIESKTPITRDTIFRVASMTKPVTTTAVMILYEEGRFLLTDPVSKYIPEFAHPKIIVPVPGADASGNGKPYAIVPAKTEITIRELLNHTSGISYGGGYQKEFYDAAGITSGMVATNKTIGDMVKRLAEQPLAHEPGAEWTYGLSDDVLGYFVEVISGQSFSDFLQERIFTPLKMTDSFLAPPADKLDRIATMYTRKADGSMDRQPDSERTALFKSQKTYYSGGAGLYSTVDDYWRFGQMLLNGGELEGTRILSRKSVELMTSDSTGGIDILTGMDHTRATHGDRYGLGLGIRFYPGDCESIGTFGWGGAFHTLFWVDPKEDMIGIFMSQLGGMSDKTQHRVFRILAYSALEK